MTKRSWLAWAVAVTLIAVPTVQTYANISEAAVLFLRIASGARPAGMGEAFVALADDATATHWNPAGLGRYPLADLWLEVPIPRGRELADFAVVENDVPEKNYTRYDIWVLTRAQAGYYLSGAMRHPQVEPLRVPEEAPGFKVTVDGTERGPFALPGGVYGSADELVSVLQSQFDADEWMREQGVRVEFVEDGDRGRLKIVSGSTGTASSVEVSGSRGDLPAYLAGGRSTQGWSADLMRATPPSHHASAGNGGLRWEVGDTYEPDASENLRDVVRSRTGLPEGEELDARVAEVARLNQHVTTDSLRTAWEKVQALPGAELPDTLAGAFQALFDHNDVLNTDAERLDVLIEEIEDILRDDTRTDDAVYRLQVLCQRARVPYLPEEISIPFALNLPGKVTAMASRKRTVYLGTTRGLLMYADGRSVALNDTTGGRAPAAIHDVEVTRTGAIWVATDQGVSRYTSVWTHFGPDQGYMEEGCDGLFMVDDTHLFAYTGNLLYRYDEAGNVWLKHFIYRAGIGDHLGKLPGKLFGIQDSLVARAYTDSLVKYAALADDELQPGTEVRIPYHLALRGAVTAMAKTSDGTLWIGTERGLVSIDRDHRVRRYGYTSETIKEPTNVLVLAQQYVGADRADRAARLAERIKADNFLDDDMIPAGRVVDVFSGVTGGSITSLSADGSSLLIGTEFGTVEHDGKDKWYRYMHSGLENYRVHDIAERDGERWYAADDRVVVYAHPRKELTLMHVKWLPTLADDLYYEFASYVMPLKGWGTVGANITFLSLGDQTRTDEFGNILGEFGTFELAGTVSYGTKLTPKLAAGVSARVIYSHLSDQGAGAERGSGTATGVAVDLGAIWQTPFRRLDLGMAITNLGPNISYIDAAQADPLPRNLALGFAYRLIHSPYNRLTVVGEVNKDLIRDNVVDQLDEAIFNGGLEYQYGSFIALRAGYIWDEQGDIKKPTLGAGLQYRNILFDFAYIPSSSSNKPLDNTTRLSLSLRW